MRFLSRSGQFSTFDPAAQVSAGQKTILRIFDKYRGDLSTWEKDFLNKMYCLPKISQKQYDVVLKIEKMRLKCV